MSKRARTYCRCCERGLMVHSGELWQSKHHDACIRIVSAERDGAFVEQVGREDVDTRWGISYADLLSDYRRNPLTVPPLLYREGVGR